MPILHCVVCVGVCGGCCDGCCICVLCVLCLQELGATDRPSVNSTQGSQGSTTRGSCNVLGAMASGCPCLIPLHNEPSTGHRGYTTALWIRVSKGPLNCLKRTKTAQEFRLAPPGGQICCSTFIQRIQDRVPAMQASSARILIQGSSKQLSSNAWKAVLASSGCYCSWHTLTHELRAL